MRVILMHGDVGGYEIGPVAKDAIRKMEKATGDSTVLFQTDWDFPSLASSLGWNMRSRKCEHRSTDGTVTCRECGKTASEFIGEAIEWLDRHEGKVFQNTSADDYILNRLSAETSSHN